MVVLGRSPGLNLLWGQLNGFEDALRLGFLTHRGVGKDNHAILDLDADAVSTLLVRHLHPTSALLTHGGDHAIHANLTTHVVIGVFEQDIYRHSLFEGHAIAVGLGVTGHRRCRHHCDHCKAENEKAFHIIASTELSLIGRPHPALSRSSCQVSTRIFSPRKARRGPTSETTSGPMR